MTRRCSRSRLPRGHQLDLSTPTVRPASLPPIGPDSSQLYRERGGCVPAGQGMPVTEMTRFALFCSRHAITRSTPDRFKPQRRVHAFRDQDSLASPQHGEDSGCPLPFCKTRPLWPTPDRPHLSDAFTLCSPKLRFAFQAQPRSGVGWGSTLRARHPQRPLPIGSPSASAQ